jgi:2,3-bisphosphoglycerate-independent phosphoglycerate mutase
MAMMVPAQQLAETSIKKPRSPAIVLKSGSDNRKGEPVVADDPHDESHYRKLAEEVAARAAAVTDAAMKEELIEIAARFMRLAEHAAWRKNPV